MMATLLSPDDPDVTGADIWPIVCLGWPCPENSVFLGKVDGKPFWSDGGYMERGKPPAGTTPHPSQIPFAFSLAKVRDGGQYVPLEIGPYLRQEEEPVRGACDCERGNPEDICGCGLHDEKIGALIAAVMLHARTGEPIVAVQAKYLNRIRRSAREPVYYGARSLGPKHWPVVVFDRDRPFALVMGCNVNDGDLEGALRDARKDGD